jgi:hypothetical protein
MQTEQIAAAFDAVYVERFADDLKRIAREEFGWDGEKDDRGRKLLQVLGTECGRAYNPSIWVDKLLHRIKSLPATKNLVLIDDLRFDNEAEMVRDNGGKVVNLTNRSYDLMENAAHSSEAGVSPELIDFHFDSGYDLGTPEFDEGIQSLAKTIFYYYG